MVGYLKKILLLGLMLIIGIPVFAQVDQGDPNDTEDVVQYEEFLDVVNTTLQDYYRDFASTDKQTDSIIASFGYEDKDVPEFSDSVYCMRLNEMNEMSPFQLDCNNKVLSTIKYFTKYRRHFTSVVLGRSHLYFPMFEEKLAAHDMPIELKYLAVIESGLRPQIRSRAGALGLWQFMYRTGRMYGLNQNSYIDERMDPELETEAACLYLKKLYSMYNNWNMALAAYNAGPGNVNKAIRRSGGKMTYWGIRPYLPRETQGYVPNFIAMSYMLTYHAEHNIKSREPKFYDFEVDTVCLNAGLHMEVIDSLINWPITDIQALNPIFKTKYIPKTATQTCINIPSTYIGKWIEMEDSIYTLDSLIYHSIEEQKEEEEPSFIVHYVRSGQTLGGIAQKYGTSVRKVMNWNNLRSTRLSIGQRLRVYSSGAAPAQAAVETPKAPQKSSTSTVATNQKNTSGSTTHIISSGDSLWTIAQQKGTTVDALLKLNPGIDFKDLKVGQKIRVE